MLHQPVELAALIGNLKYWDCPVTRVHIQVGHRRSSSRLGRAKHFYKFAETTSMPYTGRQQCGPIGSGCVLIFQACRMREAKKASILRNNCNARDRMNLHPFRMEGILYISTHDSNVRAHWRQGDMIRIVQAGRFGVGLGHGKSAHNFKNEVAALITDVPSV